MSRRRATHSGAFPTERFIKREPERRALWLLEMPSALLRAASGQLAVWWSERTCVREITGLSHTTVNVADHPLGRLRATCTYTQDDQGDQDQPPAAPFCGEVISR